MKAVSGFSTINEKSIKLIPLEEVQDVLMMNPFHEKEFTKGSFVRIK